jgi:hypothetical protein
MSWIFQLQTFYLTATTLFSICGKCVSSYKKVDTQKAALNFLRTAKRNPASGGTGGAIC